MGMVYCFANLAGGCGHIGASHNASAHDDDSSTAGDSLGTGEGIYAACCRHGSLDLFYDLFQEIDCVATGHLLVDSYVNADVVHTKGIQLAGALYRIRNGEKIHHDLHAVFSRRSQGILDGGVVGGGKQCHYIGSGFGCHLHLHGPGVHGLHIGYDLGAGQGLLHLAHSVHALALDERCSCLNPVCAARDCLFGYLN